MSVSVIVPTVNRPDALLRLIAALRDQTLKPHQVVICLPELSLLPAGAEPDGWIKVVGGVRGASAQRNAAVAAADPVDYFAFFDDDSVPRADFLAQAVAILDVNPEVVALTGRVARDGVRDDRNELTPDEITQALADSWQVEDRSLRRYDELYGCNMVVRAADVLATPFDEALPCIRGSRISILPAG